MTGELCVSRTETPLGTVVLGAREDALVGLWFLGQRHFDPAALAGARDGSDLPAIVRARRWLERYLAGGEPGEPPAMAPVGTPFQHAVWEELARVPYGETVTYGELAARVGGRLGRRTSPRAVGAAVGRNPVSLVVPCHRVVGADGSLTGYAGGLWRKRALLALERGTVVAEAPSRPDDLVARLLDVWERSVRATHDFLGPGEVERLRAVVPGAIAAVPRLLVAYREGEPVGFAGVDGAFLEMLFVDPAARGTGVGRLLLERATELLCVRELSVNEQNPQAVGFYEHLGFSAFRRTPTDGEGAPYPLLFMRRAEP